MTGARAERTDVRESVVLILVAVLVTFGAGFWAWHLAYLRRIYEFAVPDELDPIECLAGELGIATVGEDSIVKRILYGFDDKISDFMPEEKRKELTLRIPYLNLIFKTLLTLPSSSYVQLQMSSSGLQAHKAQVGR